MTGPAASSQRPVPHNPKVLLQDVMGGKKQEGIHQENGCQNDETDGYFGVIPRHVGHSEAYLWDLCSVLLCKWSM